MMTTGHLAIIPFLCPPLAGHISGRHQAATSGPLAHISPRSRAVSEARCLASTSALPQCDLGQVTQPPWTQFSSLKNEDKKNAYCLGLF